MRTLVLMMFCLWCVAVAAGLVRLGRAKYPRTVTWKPHEDAIGLALALAFAIWAAWLLWGAQAQ